MEANLRLRSSPETATDDTRRRMYRSEWAVRMAESLQPSKPYQYQSRMERNLRKTRQGVVVSNKMDKTIVVAAKFKEKHPIYGKFVSKTKKYHAHDEKNDCNVGDTVLIMETRPLSKTKRWRVVNIVERAK